MGSSTTSGTDFLDLPPELRQTILEYATSFAPIARKHWLTLNFREMEAYAIRRKTIRALLTVNKELKEDILQVFKPRDGRIRYCHESRNRYNYVDTTSCLQNAAFQHEPHGSASRAASRDPWLRNLHRSGR